MAEEPPKKKQNVRYPGESEEAYPDVFTVMPPQPKEKKPGQLPEESIKQYFDKGYVIVEDFFSKDDLDACRESVREQVDRLAQKLFNAGKIKNLYMDQGFFQRLIKIEEDFPGANILLHKSGEFPPAFQKLWSNPRLLNVIEQLIGPDIMGHPVWNLRTKTPNNEATIVPWHQDSGYLDTRSYGVLQVGAWIPLLDATEENGCMQIAAGGHKKGQVAQHKCCYGGTWYVMLEEEEMAKTLGVNLEKDLTVCPVPYGGMLLFNNMLPHKSLPNKSKDIRWSLDLRWQTPDKNVGFYDLKPGLLMQSSKDPDFKIDWDSFNKIDRHKEQTKSLSGTQGS
ncbi:1-deoxypentalenic acid 11-beta-hydroxylase-like [Gigantopelta aegis]|uniref:1-deoxypentalenic acid 11-beta-hydroxylase-like n=1 Tax=Gigantopelta aegis TaxID=1735272 RepID=UPI001B88769A|nr:1-deoxypentalenic acid 11-beta-hydroxylase-like [Gigantopelta aegis]XP_041352959.1 1-deoxypentalenic acid 11-beta-hydroxylase-like [Gigantopelta aegis]